MTKFLRLFNSKNKQQALDVACEELRGGRLSQTIFVTDPSLFPEIPGAPFAYWISNKVRSTFTQAKQILAYGIEGAVGVQTSDNFRFLRLNWEVVLGNNPKWTPYAKGGSYSKFYGSIDLLVNSGANFSEIVAYANNAYPYLNGNAQSLMHADQANFGQIGLTWTKSTTSPPSFRFLPIHASYSDTGPTAWGHGADPKILFALCALMNSRPFEYLLTLSLGLAAEGRKHYEIGVVNKNPIPDISENTRELLSVLSQEYWRLKRSIDTTVETSHAFVLPATLRARGGDYNPQTIEAELVQIQTKIDTIVFELYGFSENDRAAMQNGMAAGSEDDAEDFNDQSDDDSDDENGATPIDDEVGLLSWTVGVAFGRYDWRLATAEREAPEDPEPFDPLPTKSPGMLPDSADPFHAHAGILVDDERHPHDLAYLVEEVLQRVDAPVPENTRRWLQREFFPFHLRRYSKSRRKAPIYWPLSTLSGSYTLWLYYPDLTSQTLYTAINDFVEPKLKQVRGDLDSLRGKGNALSKQEEQQLEVALDLSKELADFRDALLAIAPNYSPNHDDGVQITAAPLWQLFRHKSWQKVLNDTWEKLEHGEYDWSHLSMNYWPERVLRKCHQDRSLAIAHDVEDTFWHEVPVLVVGDKKSTGETKLTWEPKNLTDNELNALIEGCIKEKTA